MAAPFHSIVMISYQQRALVEDAVRSVREQDDQDWELIAVDDGSTDGTLALLQHLALEDPRIQVVAKTNTRLPSIARNVGLEKARGTVVSFLDGDDQYTPGRLARVRRAFEACPDANILFGDYKPFGMPKWDAIAEGYLKHLGMDDRYASLGQELPSGDVCIPAAKLLPVLVCEFFGAFTLNIAIRRDVIASRKLRFDESLLMAEDHDFVVRALGDGSAIFVRQVLGNWLRQWNTISSSPNAKGHRDAFEVLERHLLALDVKGVRRPDTTIVRGRLADRAFEWGYAAAQARDFTGARQGYLAALRYRPDLRTASGYLKALLRLSRRSQG
jgi:glycosyltransferase involved in cell wall biosynthesis